MKKGNILFGILIASMGFLGLESCDKTTDEIIEDVTPSVTCKIGGADFETNVAAGVSSTVVAVTATSGKEVVVLSLPSKDTGTYPIDIISTNATYTPNVDSISNSYVAFQGEVKITSINTLRTQIQGTFNYKAANASTLDTLHVTDGILKNIPIR